eukprot:1734959-Prymnesium_polylepis.1
MAPFGSTARNGIGQQQRKGPPKDPKYEIARLERQREALDASIAKLKGEELPEEPEEDAAAERDDGVNRVVVKFFWQQFGKVTDPIEWKGRGKLISLIRHRMGAGAPCRDACFRVLERLAADETDDVSRRM